MFLAVGYSVRIKNEKIISLSQVQSVTKEEVEVNKRIGKRFSYCFPFTSLLTTGCLSLNNKDWQPVVSDRQCDNAGHYGYCHGERKAVW